MKCLICDIVSPRGAAGGWLVAALLVVAAASGARRTRGAEDDARQRPDPARWADDMARFADRDREKPPERGAMVFIGSSSIRFWDLAASFPQRAAVNYGFGGSHLADTVYYFDRLVRPVRPQVIVVYAGDNDIHYGLSPRQVADDFDALVAKLDDELPKARLVYIAIKPSLARWTEFDRMQQANRLIAGRCRKDPRLYFLDITGLMLGRDGKPRRELFRDDGLHLNAQGYRVWNSALNKQLAAWTTGAGAE